MTAQRCQDLLQILNQYSLKPEFKTERDIAKELFTIATGKVNDDDPFYEQRLACFQEFFVFDYRLSATFSGATLFETFLYNVQKTLNLEQITEFENLRGFKHSLFRVEENKGHFVIVKDLLSKRNCKVYSLPNYSLAELNLKQYFEARYLPFQNKLYFTNAFTLHCKEVTKIIEKHIRNFVKKNAHNSYLDSYDWKQELANRNEILNFVTQNHSTYIDKIKAIDVLRNSQKLAEIPKQIQSKNLIMALGKAGHIPPYIPESCFYNTQPLIHMLSYCYLRCYRYKHIDPVKIYDQGVDRILDIPSLPKIPIPAKTS